MIEKSDDFLKEIEKISQIVIKTGQVVYDSAEFKESFFRQSSHTPCNMESMEHIEYGVVKDKLTENRRYFGLKVKGKDVLLSEVSHLLEREEIVNMIIKEFPQLTFEEAKSIQRVITIILVGLECEEFMNGD